MRLDRTLAYILVAGFLFLALPVSGWGGAQDIIFENSYRLTQDSSTVQGTDYNRSGSSPNDVTSFQPLDSPAAGRGQARRQEQRTWTIWLRDLLSLILGDKLRLF